MQIICDGLDLSDAVLKVSKAVANKFLKNRNTVTLKN